MLDCAHLSILFKSNQLTSPHVFLSVFGHVQRCLLQRRFISEWRSAAKLFEPTETCWLSTVRLALAHAIIDGGAYLAVIMGIIGGGIKTLFSESSN